MENLDFIKKEYEKLEDAFRKACGEAGLADFQQNIRALVLRVWSGDAGWHEDYSRVLAAVFGGAETDRQAVEKEMDTLRDSAAETVPGFDAIQKAGLGEQFAADLYTFLTDMSFINGDCTVKEAGIIEKIRRIHTAQEKLAAAPRDYTDMSIFDLSSGLFGGGVSVPVLEPSAPKKKQVLQRITEKKAEREAKKAASVNDTINEAMDLIDRMTKAGLGDFGGLTGTETSATKDFAGKPAEKINAGESSGVKPKEETEEKKDLAEEAAEAMAEEEPEKSLDELLAEMDALVGLDAVKKDIHAMINFIRVCKLREERGMKAPELSHHMVFSGNPGTGKTTIARMLSSLYKAIGVLKKGQLVEVDRSGLIAGYQGQTAIKTQEVIQSALGGVLFIDEAYALVESDNDTYGKECIATILKAMEDHRDELVVIVAGYDNLMEKFIDSNPGLKSRFNKYIHFPDYTGEEMEAIFLLQCRSNGYTLQPEAQELLRAVFDDMYDTRDENFGNGRTVRNTFEKIINCQATRLASVEEITDEQLMMLTLEDVKAGLEMAPEEPAADGADAAEKEAEQNV